MRRFALSVMILCAALLFASGCVNVSAVKRGTDMVVVQNAGFYLLYVIPIVTGDPARPNTCAARLFTDTLTLHNNVQMLEKEVVRQGASGYKCLESNLDDEDFIPFLLSRKVYKTSAELVR